MKNNKVGTSGYGIFCLRAAAGILASLVFIASVPSHAADVQNYPKQQVKIIAPSGPGGGYDFVGRLLASKLPDQLPTGFYIENRTGAGTLVGTQAAANAPPDGYTLVVGGVSNMVFNTALYRSLPYESASFVPLGMAVQYSYTMVTRKDLPQNTLKEVIANAKANPGKMSIATVGTGTGQQVLAAAFLKMSGTDILQVPYKSAQAAYPDLFAGLVDLIIDTTPSIRPHIDSGRIKAIATLSAKRSVLLPTVPTAVEQGLSELALESWFGLFAPRKTPGPVIDRLRAAMIEVMRDPDLKKKFEMSGGQLMSMNVVETDAFLQAERAKWSRIIREAGITGE